MGTKKRSRIALVAAGIALLVVVVVLSYFRRNQILARAWHWRHGYMVRVGDYEVPVPKTWIVISDDPGMVNLADTRIRRSPDRLADVNGILVDYLHQPTRDLDAWASMTRNSLVRKGVLDIQARTLQLGDERLVCFGGHEFRDAMHIPTAAVSFVCQSSGRLSLIFTGNQDCVEDFCAIASKIRAVHPTKPMR